VALRIEGDAGGAWLLRRQASRWKLYAGGDSSADAEVRLGQETAWRLFTKDIAREEAAARAVISGDRALGEVVLDMVSVIA
jgi:hypothetical protein